MQRLFRNALRTRIPLQRQAVAGGDKGVCTQWAPGRPAAMAWCVSLFLIFLSADGRLSYAQAPFTRERRKIPTQQVKEGTQYGDLAHPDPLLSV